MLIIPAIDLKDGHCVRLKQGIMEDVTIFSENPGEMAQHWLDQGARRLHLVDLNGAFAGKPKNESAIREIVEAIDGKIPIQLGGGIRNMETIEYYFESGITYVIIGTAAVRNQAFLQEACDHFAGSVIVGLDAKVGKVAVEGWADVTNHNVIELAQQFEDYGVEAIVYTDISRDGMLSGINTEATVNLANALTIPVIASGGITNINDINTLCEIESTGIIGAITGRAIYEGSLDFKQAQILADKLSADS